MVTESNLSTETINFIIALLQILSNDTYSFNLKLSTSWCRQLQSTFIKDKAKVKQAQQKPKQSPINWNVSQQSVI